RPGIRPPHEALVRFVQHVLAGQRLVHPVVHDARGRVEAEQVVDRGGQFERALVAVPLHGTDPTWIDDTGPEDPVGLLAERARAHGVGRGRVADVGLRVGAGQRAHRGDHAAVVLEVVVGVGDVVFTRIDVLRRHRDASVVGAHVVTRRDPVESTSVREATPGGVDLGEIGVIPPRTGLDGLEDARAVRAGFGAEDTGRGPALVAVFGQIGAGVGANVVLFVRLLG